MGNETSQNNNVIYPNNYINQNVNPRKIHVQNQRQSNQNHQQSNQNQQSLQQIKPKGNSIYIQSQIEYDDHKKRVAQKQQNSKINTSYLKQSFSSPTYEQHTYQKMNPNFVQQYISEDDEKHKRQNEQFLKNQQELDIQQKRILQNQESLKQQQSYTIQQLQLYQQKMDNIIQTSPNSSNYGRNQQNQLQISYPSTGIEAQHQFQPNYMNSPNSNNSQSLILVQKQEKDPKQTLIEEFEKNYDPYKILGIQPNANLQEIKKSYKNMALKYHPDKGGNEALFEIITKSYYYLVYKFENPNSNISPQNYSSSKQKTFTPEDYEGLKHRDLDVGSGKSFNLNKFNEIFEKYKFEEDYEEGYSNYVEKNDKMFSTNMNKELFNQFLEDEKNQRSNIPSLNKNHQQLIPLEFQNSNQQLIEYEDPEAFSMERGSIAFVELGKKKGKGNYTDQKAGYTDYRAILDPNSEKLIDPDKIRTKRSEYRNIEDIKRERENISYTIDQKTMENIQIKKHRDDENEKRRKEHLQNYDDKLRNHFESMNIRQIKN